MPIEGVVAFAAQEAYLLFETILVNVLTFLRDFNPLSHPITLDLTLQIK